jgi:uncharacterized membrane protein YpjA
MANSFEWSFNMSKKLLKARAKIVQAGLAVLCVYETVLWASPVTYAQPWTGEALLWEQVMLISAERPLNF